MKKKKIKSGNSKSNKVNKKNTKKKSSGRKNLCKERFNFSGSTSTFINNSSAPSLVEIKPKKFINRQNRTLKERMEFILKSAKFRFINERLYTTGENDRPDVFEDKAEFNSYHDGFSQQVKQWPINPSQLIINCLMKGDHNLVIADFGCGEAHLAQALTPLGFKIHSFDLVAANDFVTACDMSRTKLLAESVDVAVFCLSLMCSNVSKYIKEANRVLKVGGILKIAEVESRFDEIKSFTDAVKKHGFQLITHDLTHNFFLFFDFKKNRCIGKKNIKIPEITLKPCIYKRR